MQSILNDASRWSTPGRYSGLHHNNSLDSYDGEGDVADEGSEETEEEENSVIYLPNEACSESSDTIARYLFPDCLKFECLAHIIFGIFSESFRILEK